jgi:hypothetical protein
MARNACIIAAGMSKWGVREASLVDVFRRRKAVLKNLPGFDKKI